MEIKGVGKGQCCEKKLCTRIDQKPDVGKILPKLQIREMVKKKERDDRIKKISIIKSQF